MDAIKGSELQIPDAIFAWVLDGQGGVKPLADDDIIDKDKPCWLHLNYTHSDSADWLAATPLLPNNVRDALAGESTRPRVTRIGDGALITLRCINGSTDERPDQLVAMRLYMDERLIVSTRQRKVLALDDVLGDLKEGNGPTDSGSWLVEVCDAPHPVSIHPAGKLPRGAEHLGAAEARLSVAAATRYFMRVMTF